MKVKRILWLLLLLLPACAGGSSGTQTAVTTTLVDTHTPVETADSTPPATTTTVSETTAVPDSTDPAMLEGMYANPVLDRDFPDPDVLKVEDTYYAFATNSNTDTNGRNVNIQAAKSTDLVEWEVLRDALPALPKWAALEFGYTWAPEVTVDASGERYLMYFTARYQKGEAGGVQCIGLATSENPQGPYRPQDEEPFICQEAQGGSIDASAFVDEDGTRYLLWKNDGNSMGGQTWIHIQPISEDGLTLLGEPTRLIKADQAWEGVLVEAPTLWKQNGKYYLFYSANDYSSPRYAIGLAVAENPLGPYEKTSNPLLATTIPAGIVGPGGQDVVLDPDGDPWLLFHSWDAEGFRNMNLAPLEWTDGEPQIGELIRGPMPEP